MKEKPLIFACSGCSHAGQAAYTVALQADERGLAEMSCLAGVAAGIPKFRKQLMGREAIVVDGCPIACAKAVFERQDLPITRYVGLHKIGVTKERALTSQQLEQALAEIESTPLAESRANL